jgi:FHS family Na+ dependent glucose MFS transporter 1
MATAVIGPTLQGLAKNTDSTLAQISSLFLLSSSGYLLGSYSAGRIFDRVKGHPILCLALLAIASMMVAVPVMKLLLVLQVLFFIIGYAEGNVDVGINTLIVWLHGDRVPPYMNGLHAFYGLGTTVAPLIAVAVLSSMGSLTIIYWALAILILPAGLLILFSSSPSQTPANQQADDRPPVPILVFLTALVFFAFTGAELGFGGWIYTYTTSQGYANPAMAASVNAGFWAAITVGRLIAIPLAIKLKPRKILWVDFCGASLSLLVILFFSSNELFLWLGTIGTGLFMAPIFPTLLNDAQSRMQLSGKTTSKFFIGSSLGSMALPWLIGQLIVPFGSGSAIIVVLGGIVVAAGAFHILNLIHSTGLARMRRFSGSN